MCARTIFSCDWGTEIELTVRKAVIGLRNCRAPRTLLTHEKAKIIPSCIRGCASISASSGWRICAAQEAAPKRLVQFCSDPGPPHRPANLAAVRGVTPSLRCGPKPRGVLPGIKFSGLIDSSERARPARVTTKRAGTPALQCPSLFPISNCLPQWREL